MEYATDEKVILVLKEKENNDYGKAILKVLERINHSRFEPSIIGIIDDKKGVEKRIKKIKGMKYLKNKKVVSAVIGISLIVVLSLLLLTSSVSLGDNSLSQFQNLYFDVIKDCAKGKSISLKELKNTLADVEYENINGIVSNVDTESDESTSYNTDIYEYKSKNEIFTVAYLIDEENNKSTDKIDSVIWEINRDNKKENNIHISYYTVGGATSTFDLGINNLNLSDQEEIFKLIDATNKMYDLYFKIAREMEGQDTLTLSDIENLLGDNKLKKVDIEYEEGIRNYFYKEGELQLSIIYNEKENKSEQISIFSESDKLTSLNYGNNREDGISISIWKNNITLEQQKNLIKKLAPIYENSYAGTEKALKEKEEKILSQAELIAKEQGYTIKPETKDEIMNGDAYIFAKIKNACEEGGFSVDAIENNKEGVEIIGFELEEKSKFDDGNESIWLCVLVGANSEVVGAYLDYSGYNPRIAPINDTENFK